jgi:phage gp36-like protein
MDYIERTDINTLIIPQDLINLTNDDSYSDKPDESKISEILIYVNSLIDDSLRGRYSLPFDNVPPVIKGIAKQIARYKLYELRLGVTDSMRADLSTNLSLLKEYSVGGSKVIVDSNNANVTPVTVMSNKKAKPVIRRSFWL